MILAEYEKSKEKAEKDITIKKEKMRGFLKEEKEKRLAFLVDTKEDRHKGELKMLFVDDYHCHY